jgi:hypothetical protein
MFLPAVCSTWLATPCFHSQLPYNMFTLTEYQQVGSSSRELPESSLCKEHLRLFGQLCTHPHSHTPYLFSNTTGSLSVTLNESIA